MDTERVSAVALFLAIWAELGMARKVNLHMSLDSGFVLVRLGTVVAFPLLGLGISAHGISN